jgi:capsular exopolysaccharide synthesis family protein
MENDEISSSQPASQPDEALNLRHYWHVVLERRWLVVAVFITVFVLTLIYLFRATRIYQATATIEILRDNDNFLRVDGVMWGGNQDQDYLQTQYKNLQSRSLIASVVSKLKLDKDDRYAKSQDVVRAVAGDLQVTPIRLTRLVDVKAEHPNREMAQKIANTLAKTFVDQNLDQKKAASMDILTRLNQEVEVTKGKLKTAEEALHRFAAEKKNISFEEKEDISSQSLRTYNDAYARARSEAAAAREISSQVESMIKAGKPIDSIPQVGQNPDYQALKKELAILEAQFAELKQRYKHKMPEYIYAEEKIASMRSSMTNQAMMLIQSIRTDASLRTAQEKTLEELVKTQVSAQLNQNKERIEYGQLKREADQADMVYKTVLAALKDKEITAPNKINNMRVRDQAVTPLSPVKPRVVLTLFLGVVGGLGAAIGLAFFVNYLDDSIKSQDDVETYLKLPFLGYVPNIKTNSVVERDLQAHSHPQSNAAEGFRTIRATISLTHKPEKFRILAVTSTIPSEGKSLVASNLAIVTAQTGLKTLLIDADMRRPSVHKAFQLHSPNGLSSYLSAETDRVEPIIHTSEVPNLDVICCGSVPTNPSELIGSKRMGEFLTLLRGRYDRIILDCPPISAVSDPLILAAMTDGVVFVTKFNKIRREHARKSVQRLQNAGIHIVGTVLNDIDFEGKDSYYYSYYYYQNRYYSSHYRPGGSGVARKSDEVNKPRNGA